MTQFEKMFQKSWFFFEFLIKIFNLVDFIRKQYIYTIGGANVNLLKNLDKG